MLRKHLWVGLCLMAAAAIASAEKPADVDAVGEKPTRAPRELSAAERRLAHPVKQIQYEERLGVPTFVWSAPATVSERKARSARVAGATRVDAAAEAIRTAQSFASFYGLEKGDIAAAKIVSVHDTGSGPVIVKFQEEVGGVEVFREGLSVMMDRNMEPVALSGYLSGAARKISDQGRNFSLDERAAVAIAVSERAGKNLSSREFTVSAARQGVYGYVDHGARTMRAIEAVPGERVSPLTEPVRYKKVFFHTGDGFEPAYYLEVSAELLDEDGQIDNDMYSYVVSARDGRILYRHNLTVSDTFNYRLWATGPGSSADVPSDNPHGDITTPHPTGVPDGSFPPFIPSAIHSLQAYPFSHSATDPWLPAGATETVGNNVDAYLDRFGGNGYQPLDGDFRANTTSANTFDYTYDPNVDALANTTQQKASITSLFYIDNFLHDFFYDAGFNEAAGTAQVDNYGRGGIAGDSLRAEAMDSSGTNNANMSTPADGGRPRQQMYIWSGQTQRSITINSQPGGGTLQPTYGNAGISTTFGAQSFDVTANIVRADPPDGCSILPLTNAAALAGKIVFIDRGGDATLGNCAAGFAGKTKNAQNAGALGVIIANIASSTAPNDPPGMGGADATVTIGALSLNFNDGQAFRSTLALGTVNGRLFRFTSPIRRDGSIDAHVVSHEWGHYLSNRLVANAAGLGNQQGGGMGEGWGDFVALLTTLREGDNLVASNPNFSGAYPMVPYAAVATAPDGYYFGIRRVPYSTNMAIDPLTFRHIAQVIVPPFTGPCDGCGSTPSEVHNTGEVWTTMLWECFAALLNNHPFTDARTRMTNYAVAGLKMTPANPTFTEARDAILAAAFAADPADHALFCAAFAKRGIGTFAVAPDRFSGNNTPVTESYECSNNIIFVSASLSAPTDSCDTDSYLDNSETATLSVTMKNIGAATLSNTTANVSSSNPNVFFANGGVMTFPPAAPFQTTTGTLLVSMFGASGVQDFYIDIAVDDPDVTPAIPVAHLDVRGNANDVANASATDNVEARLTPWANSGGNVNGSWVMQQLIPSPPTLPPPPFSYSWHAPDQGDTSDIRLISPIVHVAAGGTTFTFKHRYSFENTFDGGVIETSIDNGATWVDIGAANLSPTYAAAALTTDSGNSTNPLRGRRAYTGNSAGYPAMVTVTGTLSAANGFGDKDVRIRFRAGSDGGVGGPGWDVDDIVFNSITNTPFSINVAQGPTPTVDALSPAHAWIGLKNSDDVGTNFDLMAEVLRNGVVIGTGTITNVPGGSSGFNNAKDRAITLALGAPGQSGACAGDTLSIRLSVRVTAVGGHNSGTARLWYNDAAANSRFDVTVAGVNTVLYLKDGFLLGTAPGAVKKTIDVLVSRAGGNPWKPFGTWTKTF